MPSIDNMTLYIRALTLGMVVSLFAEAWLGANAPRGVRKSANTHVFEIADNWGDIRNMGQNRIITQPRVASILLPATKDGEDGEEAAKPKRKRAPAKKKATTAKASAKRAKNKPTSKDTEPIPVDESLEALITGEIGESMGGDAPESVAPKKRGRKKRADAAPLEMKEEELNDIPPDFDLDLELTEDDIEQALAGIESGDLDVLKFLSDNDDTNIGVEAADVDLSALSGDSLAPELMTSLSDSIAVDDSDLTPPVGDAVKELSGAEVTAINSAEGEKEVDPLEGLDIDPPPLEEFKKLMESLDDQNDIFQDDEIAEAEDDEVNPPDANGEIWYGNEEEGYYKAPASGDNTDATHPKAKPWLPVVYDGGRPWRSQPAQVKHDEEMERWLTISDQPASWRVQIVSVVTNSSTNNTALEMVKTIYDYIKEKTDNDDRIEYMTYCVVQDETQPVEELEDQVQMWLEGYNTYHLVDGAAMKEAWGGIMPNIMLSENNLQAIVNQVTWALNEDTLDGALLTPRLRRVRFRGGAGDMTMGFNTENPDSEFAVVSVR